MTGFSPDEEESSAINKLAKSLYNLVSKKKNRNKGQEWILEEEKDFLYSTVQYREIFSSGEPGNQILSFTMNRLSFR